VVRSRVLALTPRAEAITPGHRSASKHTAFSQTFPRDNFARKTMRWPWSGQDDDQKSSLPTWVATPSKSSNWPSSLLEPRTLILSLALTTSTITGFRLYKTYLRRIPTVNHIKPNYFRRKRLFGQVTSVGDADNFRLYHTPGGRIAGWGWLPWKRVPTKREDLTKQTVSISTV
jgi:hypothetical protein